MHTGWQIREDADHFEIIPVSDVGQFEDLTKFNQVAG